MIASCNNQWHWTRCYFSFVETINLTFLEPSNSFSLWLNLHTEGLLIFPIQTIDILLYLLRIQCKKNSSDASFYWAEILDKKLEKQELSLEASFNLVLMCNMKSHHSLLENMIFVNLQILCLWPE